MFPINYYPIVNKIIMFKVCVYLSSGTKALYRLNQMLDFMVSFLAGMELAFVEERQFTPLERVKIYQVK